MTRLSPLPHRARGWLTGLAITTAIVASTVTRAADYAKTVLQDRPLGYWRMEETEGTSAADASGNGIHGVYGCNKGDQWLPILGQPSATPSLGRAVDLRTGALGRVLVEDDRFGWTGAGAVEAWVKVTNDGYGNQRIISTEAHGGQAGWALTLDGSNAEGWTLSLTVAGRGTYSASPAAVAANTWNHVVVSTDTERTASLYVNGELVGTAPGAAEPAPGTAGLRIGSPGAPTWTGEFVLFGLVDEVACYDHELPAGRVMAHFEAAEYTPPDPDAVAWGQAITVVAGREPYTDETEGHIVVGVADGAPNGLRAEILRGEQTVADERDIPPGARTLIPIALADLAEGTNALTCRVRLNEGEALDKGVRLVKLPPKADEVKVDRIARGVIVDGLPQVPYGFYSDADPGTLPDDEIVNGFNLISPYWSVREERSPDEFGAIRDQMDRCAAVGMKVNYHLNRPAALPGSNEKRAAIRAEVEAFRDHPALLSWYIADEPDYGLPFSVVRETYEFVKRLDPYHPVTLVVASSLNLRDYAAATDILMVDPYPIPHSTVTDVGDLVDEARRLTGGCVPIWVVPQAFGGGEGTPREPSAGEERVMTYLALLNGATGVQYFVRRAPLGNPKSPIVWSECRTMAMEVQELAPALLSGQSGPDVSAEPNTIQARAFVERGMLTLIAVNPENAPTMCRLTVEGSEYSGSADVPFEFRQVDVAGGVIDEPIDALDTRVYRIPYGPQPAEDLTPDPGNLTLNASWEAMVTAGTPANCYASGGADQAATAMVDPRVARHGRHSLRLTTPSEGGGMTMHPYWVTLESDKQYRMSIWARGARPGLRFEMSLRGIGEEQFELGTEWREFELVATAEEALKMAHLDLRLLSAGTAWFDLLQVVPAER
ncbi:MAG TPA: LamG-like jellyroll fold domain-containing protein [Armatimonadota bacterium]|nr:LamG-like jellyroll fold domain-containing protein [Armatimonadota bacterium]